ncbi:hypothetical protein DICSQDRAFT_134340 [Dichomitus squalens LYAD-421 SS1]|uniref:Eisosome component PIL1-domain-containing protein n=1 Tax=Dichomitus squalens TaxID=114155 RepID=A0A4Q9PX71_9APHY|nr:uncharacterized protein DICSQDRAFT_134340 [Dichomitus squalens LYAD-421 SS1]EJF63738.1 hypothetical protein DICSQDRAFT_134340 [Dichomitus squalens LYAD-421 SS1]TBU59312.1 hypothetical protein BD310DRAFT_849551 [Dichomitus squalens]
MFRNATRKIAHNTTLPGLAGKQDLRSLQDLIIAEKAVLNSLQRLSADFARASEALRLWGQGEGDDLGDTLTASNALLVHFSSALSVYASHEGTIREQMKAIRTREENLDELKRRRKSVFSDAEAAERKLSKMNPENKNLQQQTDHLNRLREDIRQMDADITAEEANLGDFKRSTVRAWMGRKFGGLLECCEKGAIVGELGKLVISEIPLEQTQPGLPRPYYAGHARTEFLVAEAARSVSEVTYSPEPDPNPSHRTIRPLPGRELSPVPSPTEQHQMSSASSTNNPYLQGPPQSGYAPSPAPGAYPGLPQVEEGDFSFGQLMAPDFASQSPVLTNSSVNEFGTYSSPPVSNQPSTIGGIDRDKAASPRGGRFATFPVKAAGPRPPPGGPSQFTNPYISAPPMQGGDRAPSIELDRSNHESFSSSVAQALGNGGLSLDGASGSGSGPNASSGRYQPARDAPPQDVKGGDFGPQRYSPPPPMYTPSNGQGLPEGAAPSQPPTAMQALGVPEQRNGKDAMRPQSAYDEDEGLAYMSPGQGLGNGSAESLSDSGDRRVRFGGVSDMDTELEKRHEEQEAQQQQSHPQQQTPPGQRYARVPVPAMDAGANEYQNGRTSGEEQSTIPSPQQPASPVRSDSAPREPSPQNPPPPEQRARTPPTTEALMDEDELNAAAAREVSRELDALMISSPTISPIQDKPPPSPLSSRPYGASPSPFNRQRRDPSPLPPVNTATAQPTSPKLENMYVRERDRSIGTPVGRKMSQDVIPPAPVSPTLSDGSGQQRPSLSAQDSDGTPFRTPLGTPSGLPGGSSSMYNLPATTGSGTSFSAQGGTRTISAAAFRRQQQQAPPRNFSSESVGLADISPLNVKKRPLPTSPYPSSLGVGLGPGAGPNQGLRSVSSPQPEAPRISTLEGEDDFDYISAYTDDPNRGSGYESGRFATNLEGESIR